MGTTERLSQKLVECLKMIFDAFVLFFAIFKRKLVQVLSFDKVRKALTWMHILVDLHKHFLRLSYHSA